MTEISRRDFLKKSLKVIATGVGGLTGGVGGPLLLGACGTKPSTESQTNKVIPLGNGDFLLPDGRIVRSDGSIVMTDGRIVRSDGSIVMTDGRVVLRAHGTAPTATATGTPTEAPTATATEAPTEAPTATATEAPTEAPTETPTPITTQSELVTIPGSILMVPREISENGDQAVADFLVNLITAGRIPTSYHNIPYINRPIGGIPENDDPTLLTGKREPGQSLLTLDNQPSSYEVRLYSGGQMVLLLTEHAASNLKPSATVSELRSDGGRNVHLVYKRVTLADGRPGLFIPGGKDADHNVNTPDDNVNRGNVLIVLPPIEQGNTALSMQVDTHSNWLAQFNMRGIVQQNGGINAVDLIPYLLYDPDAQRSEGHGMSTIESMYGGTNCQGAGCRVTNDRGETIASMAGIGVYIVQLDPKGKGVKLLAATVLTDSEISALLNK